MVQLEKTMFREYDVRGRVNDQEVNENSSEIMAKGFAAFLNRRGIKEVVIGYDSRSYSKDIEHAFIAGLLESGCRVINLGMVLSPILYFAQYQLKIKGGVMITASHNPNGWSGFKLGYDYSVTLLPVDIQELYQIILNNEFISGEGKLENYDQIITDYQNFVLSKVKLQKKLKIVVDCGNGTAGPIAPKILRAAGCEVIEQFCDLNPDFPNHEPNPALVVAQEVLAKRVKEEKADLGFGFDGDGDRLGFCNEKGKTVLADQALVLLARQALKENPGAAIVFDVKSTQGLIEDISARGGKPVMWITGHSYIKQKVKETNAILGGESSGHFFYVHDGHNYDDAIFAALKFLAYLSGANQTFSELMKTTPQYFKSPVWQAECADEVKYQIVEKLVAELKKDFGADRVIDINGARVETDEGWFLVRASSNLPVLVMVFEAKTKRRLNELQKILRSYLDQYPEIGKEWGSG